MAKAWGAQPRTGVLVSIAAENQRSICSTKAERIRQRGIDVALARLVGNQVDRSIDGGIIEIDGGRGNPIADRQDREDRFDRPGCAKEMADARLGRRHGHAPGGIAD